jgi:hypothetical protein
VSFPQGDERIPLDSQGLPIHGVLPSLLSWEALEAGGATKAGGVGSTPRDTWQVELGATRRLLLDERGIPTGGREPMPESHVNLGGDGWDAAFDGIHLPARFGVVAGEIETALTFRAGYTFAQMFAPAEGEFICFEPMTAASDALNSGDGLRILAPGEECRAEFALSIADRAADRHG